MPKSLKFTLDRKSLETIYVSFIRPSLEYAYTLWAGAYEKDLKTLDGLEVENKTICMERFLIHLENDKNEDFSSPIGTNTVQYLF